MEQKFLAISLNGKKSEFYFENGHVFFMSHVGKWDKSNDRQPEKRHSWKSACYLGTWDADPNDFNIDNVRGAFSDVLTATTGTINTLTPWDGPKFTRTNNDPTPTPSADPSAPANDPTPTADPVPVRQADPAPTTTPTADPVPVVPTTPNADPVAPTTATTTPTPSADPLAVLRQLLGGGTDPNTANEVAQLKQLVRILTDGLNTTRSELADVLAQLATTNDELTAIKNRQPVVTEVHVKTANGTHKVTTGGGKVHKKFARVLNFVESRVPVYLWGDAGTGKSTLARQIAEALGFDYYEMGFAATKYDYTGFKGATGEQVPTPLYTAYKYGGVCCLNEVDASDSQALLSINGCRDNQPVEFGGEVVYPHENFRLICTGNSCGTGATAEYNARQAMDGSFLNGFFREHLEADPDVQLTKNAHGDKSIQDFINDVAQSVKTCGFSIVVGARDMNKLWIADQLDPNNDAANVASAFASGIEKDTLRTIYNNLSDKYGRWQKAFKSLIDKAA